MSKDTNKNVDIELVGANETPVETVQAKASAAKKASPEIVEAGEKTCRVKVLKNCKATIGIVTYDLKANDNATLPDSVATILTHSGKVSKY
jgi:hypothetical protein